VQVLRRWLDHIEADMGRGLYARCHHAPVRDATVGEAPERTLEEEKMTKHKERVYRVAMLFAPLAKRYRKTLKGGKETDAAESKLIIACAAAAKSEKGKK